MDVVHNTTVHQGEQVRNRSASPTQWLHRAKAHHVTILTLVAVAAVVAAMFAIPNAANDIQTTAVAAWTWIYQVWTSIVTFGGAW